MLLTLPYLAEVKPIAIMVLKKPLADSGWNVKKPQTNAALEKLIGESCSSKTSRME